ncbi:MAG: ribosome biogenesis GTPase Der [Alphaproteobacteria bacterium]|nr:ribosome biogenesis GTPase Der [Alphaproteobacteria bacterium]
MPPRSFRVAIVGRPNVGKSTLFNRLAGRKLAIVDDTPGVTRDWREAPGRLGDLDFTVMDTAGFEDTRRGLEARMSRQSEAALERCDAALFLLDARAGVTPADKHFANWLRRTAVPVILVANKCEGGAGEAGRLDAFALGMGEPIAVSAEHGEGLSELYDALRALYPTPSNERAEDEETEEGADHPLMLAIVGRPNAGKSTLVNRLLGEERMLTGPEPGITRDAIATLWTWRGRPVRLIDTAGLRRKAKIVEKLESLSAADTLRAIRFAEVVVLVVDATHPFEKQDLALAHMVEEEGRALVIAVNKWDLVEDRNKAMKALREAVENSLTQIRGVAMVTCSALDGTNMDRLMDAVGDADQTWNRKISTADLNRWLEAVTGSHPPPISQGRAVRIRYMTQTKTRPPTFLLFVNKPADLPRPYLRYLVNQLREVFDLDGVPIRLQTKKGENPYAGKKRSKEEMRRLSRKHGKRR